MGGLVCLIRRNAVLKFTEVPSSKGHLMAFDSQMRSLINSPAIAEAIAENDALGHEVCAILAKKSWTTVERERLLYVVNELYEDED